MLASAAVQLPSSASESLPAPIERLQAFTQRLQARGELWPEALSELRQLLPAALASTKARASGDELGLVVSPRVERALWSLLIDLGSFRLERYPSEAHFEPFSGNGNLRRVGREALFELIDEPRGERVLEFLTNEVLLMARRESYARRTFALSVLDARRCSETRLAMLNLARLEGDPLRPDVLALMPSWPGEAIDAYLVGLLGRKHDPASRPHPFNLILERIREHPAPLSARASQLLVERLGQMLIDSDWREVSRAIELGRGLEPTRVVPLLLDALMAWDRRAARLSGSRLCLNELLRELRRISGRGIGSNPRNWISWWVAVRQGLTPLHIEQHEDGEERTSAHFFGLRPVTEGVVFLIDISGSMRTEWGTSGHSRYVEAVEQMMRFLQAAGEDTWFNVVLFSSFPLRARPEPVRATTRNLEAARESLLAREPQGGTCLQPALMAALGLRGDSSDLEHIDTIIVLCDGETQEGRAWVQPLLDEIRAEVRVQIHCVLLSGKGDGTLEALSQGTDGDFISVGG